MPDGTLDLRLDLAFALDPAFWAAQRLRLNLDEWQRLFMDCDDRQIIENISRQAGKSTSAAAKAVHGSIYDPGLTLLISPSLRQSRELFSKVMEFLKGLEPVEALEEDNKTSTTLANGSRIVSLPGEARTIRGFSAPRRVIVDEAAFVEPEIFYSIRPMLAVSGGQLTLLSTPNGRQGYFYETWVHGADWTRFKVTAEQCPRISKEYLAQELRELGPMRYAQEYCCECIEAESSAFSSELIEAALVDDFERFAA